MVRKYENLEDFSLTPNFLNTITMLFSRGDRFAKEKQGQRPFGQSGIAETGLDRRPRVGLRELKNPGKVAAKLKKLF
jgi:hypothetical protein